MSGEDKQELDGSMTRQCHGTGGGNDARNLGWSAL